MLADGGCDLLWLPDVTTMYPDGFATTVSVTGVSEGLCGAARPGHFDGVATVVCKLFNQVAPHAAFFGEKDYQQLAVIRRLATDLNLDIQVVGVPTVREPDGLALSSRNAYLSAEERARAVAFPRALQDAKASIEAGHDVAAALINVSRKLAEAGFDIPDYVELRDAATLAPLAALGNQPARLLAAARMGNTRLIDNWPVGPSAK
jgi:pantoate--beta-alanine ligase